MGERPARNEFGLESSLNVYILSASSKTIRLGVRTKLRLRNGIIVIIVCVTNCHSCRASNSNVADSCCRPRFGKRSFILISENARHFFYFGFKRSGLGSVRVKLSIYAYPAANRLICTNWPATIFYFNICLNYQRGPIIVRTFSFYFENSSTDFSENAFFVFGNENAIRRS